MERNIAAALSGLSTGTGCLDLGKGKDRRKKLFDLNEMRKPCKAHLSFFPSSVKGNVLKMTSTSLTIELLPTIIIGTISQAYDENMWEKDVSEVGKHFSLNPDDDVANVLQIKMEPLSDDPEKLDSAKAIALIERALFHINTGSRIRIVSVGISSTSFFFDAVSYLLKEWKSEDKLVQFVTSGDTSEHTIFEFCKSLCLSGICKEIEFYNTTNYHPFGYFKSKWHRS